jgi:hypothetical protein
MLQIKRIFPVVSTQEFVWYWNIRWFYHKDMEASDRNVDLLGFINCAVEPKESWFEILDLTQFPNLDHMACRIARLMRLKLFRKRPDLKLVQASDQAH